MIRFFYKKMYRYIIRTPYENPYDDTPQTPASAKMSIEKKMKTPVLKDAFDLPKTPTLEDLGISKTSLQALNMIPPDVIDVPKQVAKTLERGL